MRVLYKLVEIQSYKVPRYCPYDGAGLEYVDEYIRDKGNILYEVVRCPVCGRNYTIRKYKEIKEEVEDENDKV